MLLVLSASTLFHPIFSVKKWGIHRFLLDAFISGLGSLVDTVPAGTGVMQVLLHH